MVGSYGFGRLDMVENRRVGIKSRETYECPGALALLLAHADLEDLTLERDLHHEKLRLEPRWAELVYDGLWFSPAEAGARRLLPRVPAPRHRRGAPAPRPGPVLGGRPAQPGQPLRPRPGHLRRRRHLPPPGRRGLRAPLGPRRGHLVGRPGGPRRPGAPGDDPLARPPERRHRRRGHGLLGQPRLRPAAGPRRHRRLPGPRPRARAGAAC